VAKSYRLVQRDQVFLLPTVTGSGSVASTGSALATTAS
jgi:hypothetical protein